MSTRTRFEKEAKCNSEMAYLVCHTQIINGVDRLDPTDHKYLKVKRVKFNEKNTDPETMKPV